MAAWRNIKQKMTTEVKNIHILIAAQPGLELQSHLMVMEAEDRGGGGRGDKDRRRGSEDRGRAEKDRPSVFSRHCCS